MKKDIAVKLFKKTNSYLDMYDGNVNLNATVNKGLKFIKNNDTFDVYKFRQNDCLQKLTSRNIEAILNSNDIVSAVHGIKNNQIF
jgi:hypothetical protein